MRWIREIVTPIVGLLGIALMGALSYLWLLAVRRLDPSNFPLFCLQLVGLGFSLCLGLLALLLLARGLQQWLRTVVARRDRRAPILVLRSFRESWVARLPVRTVRSVGGALDGGGPIDVPGESLLSTMVSELGSIGRPVVVGEEGPDVMPRTPGSVFEVLVPESQWRQTVQQLMDASRCILLFPGESPSLVDEMRMLRTSDFLNKTLVVMPPQSIAPGEPLGTRWNQLCEGLKESQELQLPPYSEAGCLYVPDDRLSPTASAPIGTVRHLRSAFEELTEAWNHGRSLGKVLCELRAGGRTRS